MTLNAVRCTWYSTLNFENPAMWKIMPWVQKIIEWNSATDKISSLSRLFIYFQNNFLLAAKIEVKFLFVFFALPDFIATLSSSPRLARLFVLIVIWSRSVRIETSTVNAAGKQSLQKDTKCIKCAVKKTRSEEFVVVSPSNWPESGSNVHSSC